MEVRLFDRKTMACFQAGINSARCRIYGFGVCAFGNAAYDVLDNALHHGTDGDSVPCAIFGGAEESSPFCYGNGVTAQRYRA